MAARGTGRLAVGCSTNEEIKCFQHALPFARGRGYCVGGFSYGQLGNVRNDWAGMDLAGIWQRVVRAGGNCVRAGGAVWIAEKARVEVF